VLSAAGQVAAVLWEITAVAFLVLVILGIRKARARGKRLFADEPTARIKALSADTRMDHRWDA
jgi:FtsZ-interacting cell division protein ZipA